ncbi:hypothetical protein Tther_00469 [Tepidimonas thermarum]|uniref:Transposase n=1 Tax=Tepidimonas thermarum TaxID=335431 RepID=A0A554X6E1_9BURK|nr:hypothetical protein Tther_00469 [Tepidimonas thermarum]
MRKTRFTEEQAIGLLLQAEGGILIEEVCRAARRR